MPFHRLAIAAVLACLSLGADGATFDGKSFDDERKLGGADLVLNGVGKRQVLFLDAYHAALYLARPSASFSDVTSTGGPRLLEIRLLRDVRLSLLEDVFVDGITANTSAAELARLKPYMEDLLQTMRRARTFRKGDILRLTFTGAATQVELNGAILSGAIGDKAFNDALLAIWLGPRPVDAALKARLLSAGR